jgi:hypothetical protein
MPGLDAADSFFGPWARFWFAPTDPIALHLLRFLTGLLLLAWLLPFAGQVDSLFGSQGWFDRAAFQESRELQQRISAERGEEVDLFKPMSWSLAYIPGLGPQGLHGVYWGSIAVIVLFTLGIATRITAILCWIITVSFTANPAFEYDVDALLLFFTFYLMIGYVFFGQRRSDLSWFGRVFGGRDSWLFGNFAARGEERHRSVAANLAVRLLQVNFAIVILTTGLHKLQFSEWWSGLAFWYPNYPPFLTNFETTREHMAHRGVYLTVLSIGAYAVLFWQIGFLLFAWRRSWAWRLVLLGGGAIGWIGCAYLYGLPLLGPAFFIGALSYVAAEEWQGLFAWLAWLTGLKRLAPEEPAPQEEPTGDRERASTLITAGER